VSECIEVRPNVGFQEAFLASSADFVIGGGAAGAGKSRALLHECLRHIRNPDFRAVIFRRTTPEITNPGGLWEEACDLYLPCGATGRGGDYLDFIFPGGARIKLAHLQHEKDKTKWQGSQVPLRCFDELTHFTWPQFSYIAFSRGRQKRGRPGADREDVIRPYVRCTTNPDADSWVADMIAWWIDQETGLAIQERAGELRWFIRKGGDFLWNDTAEGLRDDFPGCSPLSMTYVPGTLADNPYSDTPEYRATLEALDPLDRGRLLDSNWLVRAEKKGRVFDLCKRAAVEYVDETASFDVELRQTAPLLGAWDTGSRAFKTVCIAGMIEWAPEPILWIDYDRTWPRVASWEAGEGVVGDHLERYGRGGLHVIDPGGHGTAHDRSDWKQGIASGGIFFVDLHGYVEPITDVKLTVNSTPWKTKLATITNEMLAKGTLRVHKACLEAWKALENWQWDVPEGVDIEEVNRKNIPPKKDGPSDAGDTILYLVALFLVEVDAARARAAGKPSRTRDPVGSPRTADLMGRGRL
jgi:hypothetical protein